jgi:hypothetical protein
VVLDGRAVGSGAALAAVVVGAAVVAGVWLLIGTLVVVARIVVDLGVTAWLARGAGDWRLISPVAAPRHPTIRAAVARVRTRRGHAGLLAAVTVGAGLAATIGTSKAAGMSGFQGGADIDGDPRRPGRRQRPAVDQHSGPCGT